MSPIEIITFILLIVLTLSIAATSVYLVLFLKSLKETAEHISKITENAEKLTNAVSSPIIKVAEIMEGVSLGSKAFKTFSSFFERKKEDR